eukprot:g2495.t1 g2495   contig12:234265-234945(+)
MCVRPTNNTIRRVSMQHVPLKKYSDSVLIDSGSATVYTLSSNKQHSVNDIFKTISILAVCFVFVLLKGSTSFHSKPITLDQISKLKNDLDSFNRLKKSFVDDELELGWDRQHISELETNIHGIENTLKQVSRKFREEEEELMEKNKQMNEVLQTAFQQNVNAQKLDHEAMAQLSRKISETYSQLDKEHRENTELRRQVAKMMEEMKLEHIPIPERSLRGKPLVLDS